MDRSIRRTLRRLTPVEAGHSRSTLVESKRPAPLEAARAEGRFVASDDKLRPEGEVDNELWDLEPLASDCDHALSRQQALALCDQLRAALVADVDNDDASKAAAAAAEIAQRCMGMRPAHPDTLRRLASTILDV